MPHFLISCYTWQMPQIGTEMRQFYLIKFMVQIICTNMSHWNESLKYGTKPWSCFRFENNFTFEAWTVKSIDLKYNTNL